MQIIVTIHGMDDLIRRLGPQIVVNPKRRFLSRSAIAVQSRAREKTPVDTGRLRNSIAVAISGDTAQIGTNVVYGIFVHLGTRPHFPPVAALAGWARRHGADPFLVARGISRNGTKARPFLRDGFNAAVPAITGYVNVMAAEIEAEMS
jgi:phage gpG-like protein